MSHAPLPGLNRATWAGTQMTWLKIGPGSGMSKFEPWPARDRPGPSLPPMVNVVEYFLAVHKL